MRHHLPILFFLAACSSPTPGPVQAKVELKVDDKTTESTEPKAPKVKTPPRVATPIPAPTGPSATVEGFGLKMELYPPFQAARIGEWMRRDHVETLMWSWWDVTAPASGRSGTVGLYNLVIVPGKPQRPGAELQTFQVEEQGEMVTAFRYGDDGTELRLAPGLTSLEGVGTLNMGSNDTVWTWKSDGKAVPWPDREFVHSADPTSGSLLEMDGRPHQPFGPWPSDKK
ncbi:MAG: hypothetical protein ACI9MC_003981 [Kiritimatiellia bacterium]|jgi:hypothetical protein